MISRHIGSRGPVARGDSEACLRPETKKGPKKSVSESSWIQDVNDAKLRFLVMRQASELLEANRLIREIVPPGTEIYIDDRGGLRPDFRLDSSERRALEYLLSEEFLLELNVFFRATADAGRALITATAA